MAGITKIVTNGISLADDVARYVKACGKRSILETKLLQGKIKPKKLGVCLPDGTINFANQKSAIEYMRTQCSKALQGKNPYEHAVSIKGSSIIDESKGTLTNCSHSGVGMEICGHGHPDVYAKGCTTAPSILDYYSLMATKPQMKEIIFNSKGERYTIRKIPNAKIRNKKLFGYYREIDVLACKHYFKACPKSVQAELNKAIREKNIYAFEDLLSKYISTTPAEVSSDLVKLTHTFWLKYAKRFGVEVETNFSHFKDLLA